MAIQRVEFRPCGPRVGFVVYVDGGQPTDAMMTVLESALNNDEYILGRLAFHLTYFNQSAELPPTPGRNPDGGNCGP